MKNQHPSLGQKLRQASHQANFLVTVKPARSSFIFHILLRSESDFLSLTFPVTTPCSIKPFFFFFFFFLSCLCIFIHSTLSTFCHSWSTDTELNTVWCSCFVKVTSVPCPSCRPFKKTGCGHGARGKGETGRWAGEEICYTMPRPRSKQLLGRGPNVLPSL